MSYDCCKMCGKLGTRINEAVTPCDKPDCAQKPHMCFAWIFGKENCRVEPAPPTQHAQGDKVG